MPNMSKISQIIPVLVLSSVCVIGWKNMRRVTNDITNQTNYGIRWSNNRQYKI